MCWVRPEARVPRLHQGKLTSCCSFFPQGVIPDDPRGQQGRSDAFEENHQGAGKEMVTKHNIPYIETRAKDPPLSVDEAFHDLIN